MCLVVNLVFSHLGFWRGILFYFHYMPTDFTTDDKGFKHVQTTNIVINIPFLNRSSFYFKRTDPFVSNVNYMFSWKLRYCLFYISFKVNICVVLKHSFILLFKSHQFCKVFMLYLSENSVTR